MQRLSIFGIFILSGLFIGLSCSANHIVNPDVSVTDGNSRPAPTPSAAPLTIAQENFVKEWKAGFESMKSEVSDAREVWKQNNVKSYSFVAVRVIGGVSSPWNRSPVLIKVDSGQPVSIEIVDKNDVSMLARTDGFEEFDTIDKLFGYMLKELENGRMVRANFDKNLAFPKFVSFMISFDIHGGRSIEISKFTRAD